MRLSEMIAHLAPATYTVVGLILFVGVFAGIVARTYWPGSAAAQDRVNRLPLEGDES
jgi:cbb3-type cytochrome oxidase subunit 3